MSKHRKTLEQKKIADLRHKVYAFKINNIPSLEPNALTTEAKIASSTASVNKYPYLLHDILKTGILTGSIVILQTLLLFLLKKHILILPMVKY